MWDLVIGNICVGTIIFWGASVYSSYTEMLVVLWGLYYSEDK